MTPRSYARGGASETICCAYIESALGLLLLAATSRGLCFLQFGTNRKELMTNLRTEFGAATIEENLVPLTNWIEPLHNYLDGRANNLDLPVVMAGTTFQQAVWRYLREIPAGQTRTYSEVAQAIGQPKAVRAVARACASNKVAIAIPCHRVVRQNGSLADIAGV